ncbi:MAG: T9SS type A sorting domain-containing protein [Candidatus Marinimicrobia bacterium]|nr:T9SS type A sorting domain-containing protein [Candidatus Neomarinimicrobiota bacterium]
MLSQLNDNYGDEYLIPLVWDIDYSPGGNNRYWWYPGNGYVPWVIFGGTNEPQWNSYSSYENAYLQIANIASPLEISMGMTLNGSQLTVSADVTVTDNITTTDNKIFFVLSQFTPDYSADYVNKVIAYSGERPFTLTGIGQTVYEEHTFTVDPTVIEEINAIAIVQSWVGSKDILQAYQISYEVIDYEVTLTPYNPPIVIPAGGGTFDYNVMIVNNTNITQTFYAVLFADMPNGNQYGPISPTPYLVQLPAGGAGIISQDLTQNVPGNAPAGDYTFYCLVGTGYNTVVDSSGFTFTKLGTVQAASGDWISYYSDVGVEMRENDMWTVDGIFREDGTLVCGTMAADERSLPVSFALYQNYPNPFNPVTTIRYELPEQSHVTIVIYDLMGREVKRLVSGRVVSGMHHVVWDGTNSIGKPVGAGVYLYQIRATDFIQTRKMLLLR